MMTRRRRIRRREKDYEKCSEANFKKTTDQI